MKKFLFAIFLISSACCLKSEKVTADIYLLSVDEQGQKIGTVIISDTLDGLLFQVDINGLPSGEHGFHIHEYGSCQPMRDKTGKVILAALAGNHYDPQKTNTHLGPDGAGHKGDLPFLMADKNGKVKTSFYNYHLSLNEIRGKSFVIHQSGDNYSDTPVPLGGGGNRIACGIIQ